MASETPITAVSGASVHDPVSIQTLVKYVDQRERSAVARAVEETERRRVSESEYRALMQDRREARTARLTSVSLAMALVFTFVVPWFLATIMHASSVAKYGTGIALIPTVCVLFYDAFRR